MDFLTAIILGFTQGITEFLPVSSTGHLILMREMLQVDLANSLAITGVFHLATTLAILMYFWNDIWVLFQALIRKMGRLPTNEKDVVLLYALAVGTIPAAIIGIVFEDLLATSLQNTKIVALMLIIGAIFFMYAEWRYYIAPPHGVITVKTGLKIGFFQALSLIPGFSRVGATVASGMLLGLTRLEAVRFSFLLAIPITFGIGLKKLFDLMAVGGTVDWAPIILGAVVSFFSAVIMIHYFLAFIRKYTLWPFIWYNVILACFLAYVAYFI